MLDYFEHAEATAIFGSVGANTRISRDIAYYNPQQIHIGANTRIDSQTILLASQSFTIGSHVHIGIGVKIFGSSGSIVIANYCGLSAGVTLFTATDDYHHGYMTNPTIPNQYRMVKTGNIIMEEHSIIGCNTVIMPGITVGYGAAIGALSFVNKSVPEGLIVSGNPIRKTGMRNLVRLKEMSHAFVG